MPIEADYWAQNLNRATRDQQTKSEQVLKVSKDVAQSYRKSFSIFEND